MLTSSQLDTPLGPMLAIADEEMLYLLEFVDKRGLEREIENLRIKNNASIIPGITKPITSIEHELNCYFDGTLTTFTTKLHLSASPFQTSVWKELQKTPYGQTRSYLEQAKAIGKETAYRAVANANGANQIAIVIPCHRIINNNGNLGGYSAGLTRKQWLLNHEQRYML